MPSLEERIAYLEGRMEDQTAATAELRTSLREFRDETGRQFIELRGEMNRRFEQVDIRFTGLDQKVDCHFTWLVGIQVTGLLAVVSGILGLYFR